MPEPNLEQNIEKIPIQCPKCRGNNTDSYKVGDLDRAYCKDKDCGEQWWLN